MRRAKEYFSTMATSLCQQELDSTNCSVPLYYKNQKNSTHDKYLVLKIFQGVFVRRAHTTQNIITPHSPKKPTECFTSS